MVSEDIHGSIYAHPYLDIMIVDLPSPLLFHV